MFVGPDRITFCGSILVHAHVYYRTIVMMMMIKLMSCTFAM